MPGLSIPSEDLGFTNPSNAFASDDAYATVNVTGRQQVYANFGFDIPAGSTIKGITVAVEANTNYPELGTRNFNVRENPMVVR
jgi:hypothetical protein